MRFIKSISITVIALFTIFIITYSARISIINSLVKERQGLFPIKVNCLDIRVARNMTVIINKLCLQSTKADIEIEEIALEWHIFPKFKITKINVKRAHVNGTEHLFPIIVPNNRSNKPHNNNQTIHQLLSETIQPYIKKIKQFALPININITELSYLPFIVENEPKNQSLIQQKKPYWASLSAVDSKFSFSLKNADKITFMKGELSRVTNKKKAEFSITLSSKLKLLKNFVNTHQLPITAKIQKILSANKISGDLDTTIKYQTDSISMQNKIPNLTIISDNGIDRSGAYKLKAALNFKSQLPILVNEAANPAKSKKSYKHNQEIALKFTGKNTVSVEYSQPHFIAMLEQRHVSSTIISILEDNPLAQLTIIQENNSALTLSNKQLTLSSIEINANSKKQIHHIKLDNIMLGFDNKVINPLTIENFIIDSQLKLSNIAKQTTEPLILHLEGSLQKTETQTIVSLRKNSSITAKKIVFTKQQPNATVTTKNNPLIKLQTLITKVEGNLQLKADNTLNANLKVDSKASQLDIPKVIKVNSFELVSEMKGNFEDIQINATASADGINLGNIIIVGPVLTPKVNLIANKLKLTDLLSLNIKLPTKIELIDGRLSYSLSGQLTDLSQFDKNLLNASISLTSVSGEVDGVWLTDLNWQQDFTLFNRKVTTLPNKTENLTITLIDTPTPITKLSVITNWTFNNNFKLSASNLKADVLGGNFSVPKIEWPFKQGHSANVQLNSIDLEQVLALDKKQGIVVTGDISGQLPITFDGDKYIIENGELHNIRNGLIQILNNPAVTELKENNTQLQLAFDALQNLHYHQLSSAVSMADDGYMLLETVIKGRNPDIDNNVNLNLNLNYDLLGLLESMSITQRFEDNIIKGLQKDKE